MKTLVLLICTLCLTIHSHSQTPFKTLTDFKKYLHDNAGKLDPIIGIWKGKVIMEHMYSPLIPGIPPGVGGKYDTDIIIVSEGEKFVSYKVYFDNIYKGDDCTYFVFEKAITPMVYMCSFTCSLDCSNKEVNISSNRIHITEQKVEFIGKKLEMTCETVVTVNLIKMAQ